MSIEITWDDEAHTRILWRYHTGWTWADFHTAVNEVEALLDDGTPPVDIIFDTGRTRPPLNGIIFTEWNQAIRRIKTRIGILVVCNAIPFALRVVSAYSRMVRSRGLVLLTARSVEDARQMITERRGAPAISRVV